MKKSVLTALVCAVHSVRAADIIKADNTSPLNDPLSWLGGTVPGPEDTVVVDRTIRFYRFAPLGGSLAVKGIRVTDAGNPLAVNVTAGAVLRIGAGGVAVEGGISQFETSYHLELSPDLELTADQSWDIADTTQAADLKLVGRAETVLDLGGRTLTKNGPGFVQIDGGYDVRRGRMVCTQGTVTLVSGGTGARSLVVPADFTARLDGGEFNLCKLSGALDFGGRVELNGGTFSVGPVFSSSLYQSMTAGGTIEVLADSILSLPNQNSKPATPVLFTVAAPIRGNATLTVSASTPRTADRLIFTGDNSGFTGTIRVAAPSGNSTLRLADPRSGSAAAAWFIAQGNALEIAAGQIALGALSGEGIVMNAGDSAASVTVGSGQFAGTLADGPAPLALRKTGPGTLRLSGVCLHTGGTSITDGNLEIAAASFDDRGDIRLEGGGRLTLAFSGTMAVRSLLLDGVPQPAGRWGAPGSGADRTSDRFSGQGIIEVLAEPSAPFDQWAAAAGLQGAEATPTADPDADGTPNLLEFAMAGDPRRADAAATLRAASVRVAGEDFLAATFPVRSGAVFSGGLASVDGISCRVEGSLQNLGSWNAAVAEWSPALSDGLPSLPSGWNYRTFRLVESTPSHPAGALRLRVSLP